MRPATSTAPAKPASPPDNSATSTSVRVTGTPANAAARALAPTARMRKPATVRAISAHIATASATAPSRPVCSRVCGTSLPSSRSGCSATLCGQPMAIGSFIGPSSRADTASSMTKFSNKVVTTSSTPSRAFISAGPSSHSAPASAAAIIISGKST